MLDALIKVFKIRSDPLMHIIRTNRLAIAVDGGSSGSCRPQIVRMISSHHILAVQLVNKEWTNFVALSASIPREYFPPKLVIYH